MTFYSILIFFLSLPPKSDQPLLSLNPLWTPSLSTFSETVFQNLLAQTLPLVSLAEHNPAQALAISRSKRSWWNCGGCKQICLA